MSIKSGLKNFFNRIAFGAGLGVLGLAGFVMIESNFGLETKQTADSAELFKKSVAANIQPSLVEVKAFQKEANDERGAAAGLFFTAIGLGLGYSGLSKEKKTAVVKFFS
jgi:hypothetical protein